MIKIVTRCHRCGTSKGDEDEGVYLAFKSNLGKETVVWFHNEECKRFWLATYGEEVEIVG